MLHIMCRSKNLRLNNKQKCVCIAVWCHFYDSLCAWTCVAGNARLQHPCKAITSAKQIQCSLLTWVQQTAMLRCWACNKQQAPGLPLVSSSHCICQGLDMQHAGGSASFEISDHRIWRSPAGLLGLVNVDGLYS